MISDGFEELAGVLERALATGGLGALAPAYRTFARRHPHLYRPFPSRRRPRCGLAAWIGALEPRRD